MSTSALASDQAALQVPYVKKLYYFLANSPVREAAFHYIQASLMDTILQLKKAVHTRWLSHDQAITVLRHTLSSVITTLECEVTENDEAVACGLSREIKTYNFIATVYLLSDILPLLTQLNLVFQTADVDLSVINSLNAKCIYTCILTQPYNHLYEACQCCVYYKESL